MNVGSKDQTKPHRSLPFLKKGGRIFTDWKHCWQKRSVPQSQIPERRQLHSGWRWPKRELSLRHRAEEMGELKNVLVAAYSTFANIEMQMNRMNQTKMHLKIGFPKLKRRFWSRLLMLFKSVSKSTLLVEFYVPDKNAFEPIFEILFKISNV